MRLECILFRSAFKFIVAGTNMSRPDRTSRTEQEIDQNLKRVYEDVANQELPSRFTDLLEQLRAKDAAATQKDGENDS
ncbi:NepR family anti-sigma factor [uncultured Tateyamaria sp.]|uniref:NepR family anti-sigma factor n=1 Tax=uncultured Tateyamaria sp. TaxID=455651 RepID=UPI0026228A74|nr:NepR family anti-sigma factor [uncultured Tateyamaria sp.]